LAFGDSCLFYVFGAHRLAIFRKPAVTPGEKDPDGATLRPHDQKRSDSARAIDGSGLDEGQLD
jgi:hypothetical protein